MTSTSAETYYRPGLVFKAHEKAFAHQECCFPGAPEIRNQDGSLQREEIRALWAEFGVYGAEYQYQNADGQMDVAADIRGGYFNLDEQAREKGWNDKEKEIVARHMLRLAESGRGQFSLYSKPATPAPWPTFDQTHHNQIPVLAAQLGLLNEALAYESENKNRDGVVGKLREELAKQQAVPAVSDDDLVAV